MNKSWMEFKAEVIAQYQQQKQMADTALGRVDDAAFFAHLKEGGDDHTNSIAILVKHISGNFISRWTDFLTSDGEKSERQRPREFVHEASDDRPQMMERWEEGWRRLFATLESLTEEDFAKTIYIRKEAHSVVKAILRNLLHASHHIGQIDLLVTILKNQKV
jgi:DNA polymerase IIIc chi subunit